MYKKPSRSGANTFRWQEEHSKERKSFFYLVMKAQETFFCFIEKSAESAKKRKSLDETIDESQCSMPLERDTEILMSRNATLSI